MMAEMNRDLKLHTSRYRLLCPKRTRKRSNSVLLQKPIFQKHFKNPSDNTNIPPKLR